MGRVLKGVLEVLLMVVVGIIGLIASNTSPQKRKKVIDAFEEDLHDNYAAGKISEIEFSRGLDRIENLKRKWDGTDN